MKIQLKKIGKKYTIRKSVSLEATAAFEKNVVSKITLLPSEELKFVLEDGNTIQVNYKNNKKALSGKRATLLSNKKGSVVHVEHLLSALMGFGIDACEIQVEGSNQIPAPDVSSKSFYDLIKSAGKKITQKPRVVAVIKEDIYFTDNEGSFAIIRPSEKLAISTLIQFPNPIGDSYLKTDLKDYGSSIASARSFIRSGCDNKKWKAIRNKIIPNLPEKIEDSPLLVFDKNEKWIVPPNSPNEPARHKILDIIGDLTTLGYPILGDITIIRPGHEFNRKLVNYLGQLADLNQ
jgi:UDP-3-O-acyl-N-acetylglucosamine deacetylase